MAPGRADGRFFCYSNGMLTLREENTTAHTRIGAATLVRRRVIYLGAAYLYKGHTHIILIAYNMHSELRGLIKRKKKQADYSERESRERRCCRVKRISTGDCIKRTTYSPILRCARTCL